LTSDLYSTEKFYCSLFGWEATKSPIEGENYTIFRKEGRSIVGMMKLPTRIG
jgi:predicted enzyme related to lactoylglutathione lyase